MLLNVFTQRNFTADFLQEKSNLDGKKTSIVVFAPPPPPLWGLGTTFAAHIGLIGKLVVDLLFVINCACDRQMDIGGTAAYLIKAPFQHCSRQEYWVI